MPFVFSLSVLRCLDVLEIISQQSSVRCEFKQGILTFVNSNCFRFRCERKAVLAILFTINFAYRVCRFSSLG